MIDNNAVKSNKDYHQESKTRSMECKSTACESSTVFALWQLQILRAVFLQTDGYVTGAALDSLQLRLGVDRHRISVSGQDLFSEHCETFHVRTEKILTSANTISLSVSQNNYLTFLDVILGMVCCPKSFSSELVA